MPKKEDPIVIGVVCNIASKIYLNKVIILHIIIFKRWDAMKQKVIIPESHTATEFLRG